MLRELLVAAQTLINKRHGADSAVAACFRKRMAEHRVPICIYRCENQNFGGFACPIGIAMHEHSLDIGSMAHEVAHLVLRHSAEQCAVEGAERNRNTWGLASLAWAVASRPAGWALLPAFAGLSYLRRHILNDLDAGGCPPELALPPQFLNPVTCGVAGEQVAGAGLPWQVLACPGRARMGSYRFLLPASCLLLPAGSNALSDEPQPVFPAGHSGFTRPANLQVAHELEADRLALLLMARRANAQHA
jgi:hypothetical protein